MHHNFSRLKSTLLDSISSRLTPEAISKNALKLSEQYMQFGKDHSQIWLDDDLAEAYLNYNLPLNLLRMKSVLLECRENGFFNDLRRLYDFGSGPGTTDLALHDIKMSFEEMHFIDKSKKARERHQQLLSKLKITSRSRNWSDALPNSFGADDLVVFSYALSEIPTLPKEVLNAEALLIIEPSTKIAARRLQELRLELHARGFYFWAPCTHQEGCPLLLHSKNDWCHQRIHIEHTEQFKKIEALLPMKNQTLTFSYLCARKKKPESKGLVRVIGDTLFEKGKVKQAICRGTAREFLTWLTRNGEPELIERGAKIKLPPGTIAKGEELRVTQNT